MKPFHLILINLLLCSSFLADYDVTRSRNNLRVFEKKNFSLAVQNKNSLEEKQRIEHERCQKIIHHYLSSRLG